MQLKDYQTDVLSDLSAYLAELSTKRKEAEEFVEFQRSKGRDVALADYCQQTWAALETALPRVKTRDGRRVVLPYIARKDKIGRAIPNICLKVPTGGGKTLLATIAVERINTEYFKTQSGFLLWVVPSDAIYAQTWKALANREHPYRQMLERASGGRVRLLEKGDAFTRQDVDRQLCVMLMMLQAGAVRKESKDARKMFQDSGRYPSFFPDVDDATGNAELLRKFPHLDVNDLTDEGFRIGGLSAKQSLGNVLRIVRPLVVIDEGHKAYTNTRMEFIASHSPRFILELSATPNAKEHVSNIIVDVTGAALKAEAMIKLPINVINEGRAEWKHALAAAKEKLDDLQKVAAWVRNNEGRYIRPILLVRVERTGRDQRDKQEIHAEDVREYLIDKMGADKDQIKVKSAEMDELAEVDKRPEYEGKGLLSEFCPVRYIITKDALREGWDCPFAYVLAVLSRTTAAVALTQMVGRVLRQPDAKWTGEPELNECYVFTHDQDVHAAVDNVRRGLQEEGLGDLAASVTAAGKGAAAGSRTETLRRRRAFRGVNVFMPRVLSKHYATGEWREFDYERDMLPRLDWNAYRYTDRDVFTPDEMEGLDRTRVRVDVGDLSKQDADLLAGATVTTEESDPAIDVPAMVRLLLDVVPNPWQGARIVGEALTALRARGLSENRIFTNRLFLVKAIKENVRTQINDASEAAFRRMLADGDLSFQLVSSGDPALNWELAQTLELEITDEDRVLLRKNGASLEKSFLEPIYQKQVNELEREVAWYLDGDKAVKWWHRIAVKQDWHLQGWQRGRIYPDFLACLHDNGDGTMQFRVLETKGLHLKGNEDTAYKERLFELLTQYSQSAVPVGELLIGGAKQRIRFDLMLENNWRERLPASLAY